MDDKGNADRFLGFAKLYEKACPSIPEQACDILVNYLPQPPDTVVDIGCGTGLSTVVWKGRSRQVVGVEPNERCV